jgi:hypothetical protein
MVFLIMPNHHGDNCTGDAAIYGVSDDGTRQARSLGPYNGARPRAVSQFEICYLDLGAGSVKLGAWARSVARYT